MENRLHCSLTAVLIHLLAKFHPNIKFQTSQFLLRSYSCFLFSFEMFESVSCEEGSYNIFAFIHLSIFLIRWNQYRKKETISFNCFGSCGSRIIRRLWWISLGSQIACWESRSHLYQFLQHFKFSILVRFHSIKTLTIQFIISSLCSWFFKHLCNFTDKLSNRLFWRYHNRIH